MLRIKRSLFLLTFLLSLSTSLHAAWKTIGPGMEYRRTADPMIHSFRIDPKKQGLDLLVASGFGNPAMSAEDYRDKSGAALVINGGFFDERFHSLGLLHRKGKTINPLRNASWGIFLLNGKDGAKIIPQQDWEREDPSSVVLALEVGPRLVVDGRIQSFKEGVPSRRSAVGITRSGWIEIALSESPISLKDWATFLQKDCLQALNLDGGGSSQISVSLPRLSLKVEGLTNVPNALAVFGK